MNDAPKIIEVFRPGRFTPMAGAPVEFSAADLIALAQSYDAEAAPAPIVVGHPATDAPAYGWARAFSYDAARERLTAEIGEVEPAFAEAVAAGRYRKISLSLFSPDAPNNPKPGVWYPKHVGFLGAAAPAVSGLKPVAFAAPGVGELTFEFADASALRDVASLFQNLREWMIEKFGAETADRVAPGWTIKWIDEAGEREPPPEPYATPGFAAPSPKEPQMTIKTPPAAAPANEAVREAAFAEREQALAARERQLAHADNLAFAEKLIGEGRFLPVLKDKLVGLLDGLSPAGGAGVELSFAEGATTKTAQAADLTRELFASLPPVISFGALDLGIDPGRAGVAEFATPPGVVADPASLDLHNRALAFQAAHPGTDYMAAVAAVNR
jgi:hypothetical protein